MATQDSIDANSDALVETIERMRNKSWMRELEREKIRTRNKTLDGVPWPRGKPSGLDPLRLTGLLVDGCRSPF